MRSVLLFVLSSLVMTSCEVKKDQKDGGVDHRLEREGGSFAGGDLFSYDVEGDSIIMRRDLLIDSTHYDTIIVCESDPGVSGWAAAGGCSILKDGSTYYVIDRQRSPVSSGFKYEMWSSSDLATWTLQWKVETDSVVDAPITPLQSFEGSSLRKYGNRFYLYFCCRNNQTTGWDVYYIVGARIAALMDSLKTGSAWHPIWTDNVKDPWVMKYQGKYYMLVSKYHMGVGTRRSLLLESNDPTFASWDTISCPTEAYAKTHRAMERFGAAGMILHDGTTGNFIYWNVVEMGRDKDSSDLYWFWARTAKLSDDWKYVLSKRTAYSKVFRHAGRGG